MTIGIANDHQGTKIKHEIVNFLKQNNYDVINYGTDEEESVNYPTYAFKLCEDINKKTDFGILICKTGIGMSMAANKVHNIRCAKVSTIEEAKLTREHNNANVIALASDTKNIK